MTNASTIHALSIYFHVRELCLSIGPLHHNVQNCLFLQLFVRSRRLDEQLTVTIIRLRPEQLGMALAGFSGRAQHCPDCLFSVSVCIREMQGRKSVFVSIFILKPLRELSIASGVTSSFPRDSHSCASELRQLKT